LGLINQVVETSQAYTEALALATAFAERDPLESRSRNGKDEVDRRSQAWLAQEKRT
jgi:hypothetical protein